MSLLLEQEARKDPQRSRDLDATDAQMGFSERDLILADLAYLAGQKAREARRIALLHEEELNRLRAVGGV